MKVIFIKHRSIPLTALVIVDSKIVCALPSLNIIQHCHIVKHYKTSLTSLHQTSRKNCDNSSDSFSEYSPISGTLRRFCPAATSGSCFAGRRGLLSAVGNTGTQIEMSKSFCKFSQYYIHIHIDRNST